MLFGSRLNRLATSIRQGIGKYAVGSSNPGLVFDFIDNFYQKDKNQTVNFDGAITHVRNGNATMTDGYGPELVVNGGFDSDLSGYSLGNSGAGVGWVWKDGKAVVDNAGEYRNLQQDILEVGKTYVLTFDKKGSGSLFTYYNTGLSSFENTGSSEGRFTYYLEAVSDDTIVFSAGTLGVSIDNVSVREMPVIKWAPHNLLSYSEDFSQSVWNKANATVSGQEVTVTTASATNVLYQILSTVAGQYRLEAEVKAGTTDALGLKLTDQGTASHTVTVDLTAETISAGTGTTTDRSIEDIGDGWYLIGFNANIPAAGTDTVYFTEGATAFGSGDTFFVRNVRLFRSDLGGMVDNPDQPPSRASYVPTTTAAKYLPRIGHHVYNGSAWANEGLLAESEARTNLIERSNTFNSVWSATGLSSRTANEVGPDGVANSAYTLTSNTGAGIHANGNTTLFTSGSAHTGSCYFKKGTQRYVKLKAGNTATWPANVTFDLESGVVDTETSGTGTIQEIGNGWYRCSVTATAGATANTNFYIYILNDSKAESYTATGAETTIVWGAQVEVGATPSSFIPSDDGTSTVTRAAESFTIPSANLPWPSPNYIGSELVTNGTFDTDTSNWTATNSTLSLNSNRLKITNTAANGYAYQQITTTAGKVYALNADFYLTTFGAYLRLGTTTGTTNGLTLTASGNYTVYFVADDTTTFAKLQVVGGSSGDFVEFDNISVREINPLSVSIGMEGRMTYADTDSANEINFVRWLLNASNQILIKLRTNGANEGEVFFRQEENNVTSDVATAGDLYQAGVLLPFDLAQRSGSTFINGAVNGVALTANTTPTALPDLSSSDLELAQTYMGTISEFRVWDKDITDDGLVEATNPSLEPSLSLTFEGKSTNSFTVSDWSE